MTFNQIHSNTSTCTFGTKCTMRVQMHSNQQFADIQDMTSQASECRSRRGVEVDQGIRTIWIRKMSMNPIVRICLGGLRVHSRDDSLHLICRSSRIVAMAYQMQALEIRRKIKLKKNTSSSFAKLWVRKVVGCKGCNRETTIQPPQCNLFWTSLLNLWYSTGIYFSSNFSHFLPAQANVQMNYNKLLWSGWSRWLPASSWQCSASKSHGQWYAWDSWCPVCYRYDKYIQISVVWQVPSGAIRCHLGSQLSLQDV